MSDGELSKLQSKIFHSILEDGHMVHFVEPNKNTEAPGRAYTIGLTMRGRPEIIVTGLNAAESIALLDELVERDRITPFSANDGYRAGDFNIRFREAEPMTALGALATFGRIELLQAGWVDTTGRRNTRQPWMSPGTSPIPLPTTDPYGDIE